MAGLKEIKRRLRSVNNTKKITYAMKLVSSAKLKRAQESVRSFRVYKTELDNLLSQVQFGLKAQEATSPLMVARREVKNVAFLIVGGQRGLCGGYNTNLHRKVEAIIKEHSADNPGVNIHCLLIGKKLADYFRRVKRSITLSYETLSENVSTWPLAEINRSVQESFLSAQYDEVWLIYTKFKSAISQSPVCEQLLPIEVASQEEMQGYITEIQAANLTKFEPSKIDLFRSVLPRVMNSKIRQACLEAKASETGSRMTAMDSATRNATQLAKKLGLTYNKLRQNKITTELLDIVGGAEAIK